MILITKINNVSYLVTKNFGNPLYFEYKGERSVNLKTDYDSVGLHEIEITSLLKSLDPDKVPPALKVLANDLGV